MKLTEMLGQYEELLDKKDQLAKDTKDNNAARSMCEDGWNTLDLQI